MDERRRVTSFIGGAACPTASARARAPWLGGPRNPDLGDWLVRLQINRHASEGIGLLGDRTEATWSSARKRAFGRVATSIPTGPRRRHSRANGPPHDGASAVRVGARRAFAARRR